MVLITIIIHPSILLCCFMFSQRDFDLIRAAHKDELLHPLCWIPRGMLDIVSSVSEINCYPHMVSLFFIWKDEYVICINVIFEKNTFDIVYNINTFDI